MHLRHRSKVPKATSHELLLPNVPTLCQKRGPKESRHRGEDLGRAACSVQHRAGRLTRFRRFGRGAACLDRTRTRTRTRLGLAELAGAGGSLVSLVRVETVSVPWAIMGASVATFPTHSAAMHVECMHAVGQTAQPHCTLRDTEGRGAVRGCRGYRLLGASRGGSFVWNQHPRTHPARRWARGSRNGHCRMLTSASCERSCIWRRRTRHRRTYSSSKPCLRDMA